MCLGFLWALGRTIPRFRTDQPGATLRCHAAGGSAGAMGSLAELPAHRSRSCSLLSCSCQVGSCVFLSFALLRPCPKINLRSFLALHCAL